MFSLSDLKLRKGGNMGGSIKKRKSIKGQGKLDKIFGVKQVADSNELDNNMEVGTDDEQGFNQAGQSDII